MKLGDEKLGDIHRIDSRVAEWQANQAVKPRQQAGWTSLRSAAYGERYVSNLASAYIVGKQNESVTKGGIVVSTSISGHGAFFSKKICGGLRFS